MVLGGGHNADRIAIDEGKNRNLASCHELLDDHLITGRTKLLVLHDLLDACLCFFQRITDQNTFSKCQTICFQNDRHLSGL